METGDGGSTREEDHMREQVSKRLGELKEEFESGQTKLREVERQEAYLRETLLRISGAIQVLEELDRLRVETPDAAERNGAPA
jgi:hypothetical protein